MAKIRQRETTANIAVIFTETGNQELSDWDVTLLDRKRGVLGHGAHYLIHKSGEYYPTRDQNLYGNIELKEDEYNEDSVFVRIIGNSDDLTEQQVDSLEELLLVLQEDFPDASVAYPS